MECDKAFDHCSLREDWCHLLPKFFQNPSESTNREFAQCCFNCVFCSVLKSQRHILKVMKWWCGDVSSKGEYEWQQSAEKQVRPFLLQPSLHSVQKPKEYPFWSLLFVETNSIGIQTKLNQWKYDIERKTSFEAWTNSPKKVNLMFLFQREGFSLNHFLLARNIGKDILPNATNRDVTMLLERDGGEGGQGEEWSYLILTSLSHERWYRKKCPSNGKGTPFFFNRSNGFHFGFQWFVYWCTGLGVCVFWYGGRFLKCIGSLSNIDLEIYPPLRQYTVKPGWIFLMALKIIHSKKPIVKSFEQWQQPWLFRLYRGLNYPIYGDFNKPI